MNPASVAPHRHAKLRGSSETIPRHREITRTNRPSTSQRPQAGKPPDPARLRLTEYEQAVHRPTGMGQCHRFMDG
jgi:hypothetical protein